MWNNFNVSGKRTTFNRLDSLLWIEEHAVVQFKVAYDPTLWVYHHRGNSAGPALFELFVDNLRNWNWIASHVGFLSIVTFPCNSYGYITNTWFGWILHKFQHFYVGIKYK
mmetsp:Transcript_38589/g.56819  ORF Transcript_38589/g.56819 Transcript_38589/m.56819 type:complete len:110 (+) Transcript_38589:1235-1564(+)